MPYPVRMPSPVRALFPEAWCRLPAMDRQVYLTFDDGPCPAVTPQVLDMLDSFGARATFFTVGSNAAAHPELVERVRQAGHTLGNHTQHHVDGWRTPQRPYLREVLTAQRHTTTALFRPPYGRITHAQYSALGQRFRVVLWDVLSGDFDTYIDAEHCARNVLRHVRPGSIVVFHDSRKAADRCLGALPKVLRSLGDDGYACLPLPADGGLGT
jgi:peptidoglycan/xylan/chitin deacetylase (PgdA/CDA1 family)